MRKVWILILFLSLVHYSFAAVGFDAATPQAAPAADCTTGTSRNWTHEGGGAGVTALVVSGGNLSQSSVTFNGVNLTAIANLNATTYTWVVATTTYIAASGTVTVNTGNDAYCGGSMSFTGTQTNTASLVGATSTLAASVTTSYSINITTTANGSMNVDFITRDTANDLTVTGSGQTLRIDDDHSGGLSGSLSTQPAATIDSYTMSGTWSGSVNRRAIMAEILAAVAASVDNVLDTQAIFF